MLCVVETPIDLAMWVKLDNLIRNKRGTRNGVVAIEILANADLAKMNAGEKLTLIAHGGYASFGGMTAKALASELIERKLRADIASIRLSGCNSGSSNPSNNGAPVCLQLARELYAQTQHTQTPLTINVTGFVGTAVTFPDGRVRAKIAGMAPQHGPSYDEILDKYKNEKIGWDNMAAKADYSTQEKIIQSAREIAAASKDMFQELYDLNEQVTLGGARSRIRIVWE